MATLATVQAATVQLLCLRDWEYSWNILDERCRLIFIGMHNIHVFSVYNNSPASHSHIQYDIHSL